MAGRVAQDLRDELPCDVPSDPFGPDIVNVDA